MNEQQTAAALSQHSPPTGSGQGEGTVVFHTRDLTLRYGRKTAFTGVDLSVPALSVTALIGPSGCGKTSFLCCLNRLTDLLPRCYVTGAARYHDADLLDPKLNVIDLRRRVGMIFQKPNPFPMSIRRNLELGVRELGVTRRAELEQVVEDNLRAVGLWEETKDRLKRSAHNLSGGQQQRLCIARALALKPEVLLMDEPCSALDPISTGVIEDLISELRRRITIVIVTHNLAQARRIADNAAMFWTTADGGRLIESGPTETLFTCPSDSITSAYVQGRQG